MGVNVWTAGYDSGIFGSVLSGGGASIGDHASSFIDLLTARYVGKKRLAFVVHSLGGLIVKQMLRRCSDSSNPEYKALLAATKGVSFIGTPHAGAGLSTALKWTLGHFTSVNIGDLTHANEALLDLGYWFSNWAPQHQLRIAAYHEVMKTNGVMVVDKVTANPNVYGCDLVALNANHIDMCKATSTDSQLYTSTLHFINALLPPASPSTGASGVTNPEPVNLGDGKAASGDSQSEQEALSVNAQLDYDYFSTEAAHDRRSLEAKLKDANREYEVRAAEQKKERFAKTLYRHVTQPSSLTSYLRLLASVEMRYRRMVVPAIVERRSIAEINGLIVREVIEPIVASQTNQIADLNEGLVESALYYLTGNCHVGWDAP